MPKLREEAMNPSRGTPDWVTVKDREEAGRVVDRVINIGATQCYALLFESTGQVCYYRASDVTPVP